ncbi:DUF4399 domain-containing protein [Litoribrevibacter albus]|uniref:DUF4399 domain-containing protein n=1 Tax=Litoribrevibacter albus TaxID=1473156 RepID=A0AA37W905_9GAMM|nr:DUF4399 domain-containing protein [Litoribrevibacter albus]GLQ32594.1 hypothetical protein GCM10007876_30730 [Litoribrevibacter albus]
MKVKTALFLSALSVGLSGAFATQAQAECGHCSEAPANAQAYIISPQHGETVDQTFTVKFGLTGMGVAPAGMDRKHTGHHHLLVDGKLPPMDQPMGKNVKHFGGGQTETTLTLTPGTHTLQLILGDMKHQPHNPPVVSEPITITVK